MKIIDLTWRLPGPLATSLLAKQGMEVIKYEDLNHRDPFLKWSWDPAFIEVYHALQNPKELRLIDFGNADDVSALHDEIQSADAVALSFPSRVEEKLGLTESLIAQRYHGANVCFTRLGFRQNSTASAHDLNTLVQSNLLKMHILDRSDDIIAPPFLPVTGMFFSHHIAITVLKTVLEQRDKEAPIQNWCWLQDAVDNAQEAYYPSSIQERTPGTFLHNGRFPCYNIYRTLDGGHLAMACVELKFWSRFRELTGLTELGDDDGLCDGDRAVEVKEIILRAIKSRTADEWGDVFDEEDVCVDVITSS
ncbi:MAG: CoA transferase [Chlorobi bacterium]|nr:CoA transferase [Chlorobiota bacterium]